MTTEEVLKYLESSVEVIRSVDRPQALSEILRVYKLGQQQLLAQVVEEIARGRA